MDIKQLIEDEARNRRMSERTIESYTFCVEKFFKWRKKEPKKVTKKDIKDFVSYLNSKGYAGNTINVYVNALRFLLQEILAKRVLWNIKYSKKPKTLPVVLTQEETARLIETIKNPKHKLLVKILYGAGLRVSEVVNLKIENFELEKGYGWVRKGKGNKDRLMIIPKLVIPELKNFLKMNKIEKGFIFLGWKGRHLHTRSVQEIVKRASKKAKIKKNVHPHTLRHSFATHLVENGYDVASVQSLLGHASMNTTMIYVHMAAPNLINVVSPLDSL
tara:strand:+ start:790 stop:1611 length:822 start_codon:yes stop_codon:yes gene_type:complete